MTSQGKGECQFDNGVIKVSLKIRHFDLAYN